MDIAFQIDHFRGLLRAYKTTGLEQDLYLFFEPKDQVCGSCTCKPVLYLCKPVLYLCT